MIGNIKTITLQIQFEDMDTELARLTIPCTMSANHLLNALQTMNETLYDRDVYDREGWCADTLLRHACAQHKWQYELIRPDVTWNDADASKWDFDAKLATPDAETEWDSNPDAVAKARKAIKEAIDNLQFLYSQIDGADDTEIRMHLGLMEYHLQDIAQATGYTSETVNSVEERNHMVREANHRAFLAEGKLGRATSASNVKAGLKRLSDIFGAWYESAGFHYASLGFTSHMLKADFSDEVELEPEEHIYTMKSTAATDSELIAKLHDKVPVIMKSLNVKGDRYRHELVASDDNIEAITAFFREWFPNVTFSEFRQRRGDHAKMALRFSVCIPYQDIDDMYDRITMANEEVKTDGQI